jgi:Icc protein
MPRSALRIIQISDIHLFAEGDRELLGVNTRKSFYAVLDQLRLDPVHPQMIILSGDLSQDGSEASYRYLAQQLKEFKVPVYYVPGNHDDAKVMLRVYPDENISGHKHIVLKEWQIILLDSHKPKAVEGYLDPSQLHYMQHCLQTYPEHRAIVVFHHQPVPMSSVWLDQVGLTNAEEFWAVAANFPALTTVLFGHVHQLKEGKRNGIKYYSTPATCFQFKGQSDQFGLEKLAPGYRWLDLYPDGEMKTDICRVPQYIGNFDESSEGY